MSLPSLRYGFDSCFTRKKLNPRVIFYFELSKNSVDEVRSTKYAALGYKIYLRDRKFKAKLKEYNFRFCKLCFSTQHGKKDCTKLKINNTRTH